jgi:hypothetical protein
MTTLRQIELRCPVCDNEFRSQSVVSTNAFGGKRTDFHERAAGTQPLAYLIHMCSECGYSGGEADFTAAAVSSLKRAGANRIRFLCLVAAPEGVRHLSQAHPDVQIYCAALDRELNRQGYILPGLGDAGDRLFGTR